jgi:hypothetical protein
MKMTNWKTTLFGSLAAICIALSGVFPEYKELLIAVGGVFTAIFALVSKDADVTGGTRKQ